MSASIWDLYLLLIVLGIVFGAQLMPAVGAAIGRSIERRRAIRDNSGAEQ